MKGVTWSQGLAGALSISRGRIGAEDGQEMEIAKLSQSGCLVVLVLPDIDHRLTSGSVRSLALESVWLLSLGQIMLFITDFMSAPESRLLLIWGRTVL